MGADGGLAAGEGGRQADAAGGSADAPGSATDGAAGVSADAAGGPADAAGSPAPDAAPPVPVGGPITAVAITNAGAVAAKGLVTFAQPFKPGDVPAEHTLAARGEDGGNVRLQVDAKARHADGSLRHAVITAEVPPVPARGKTRLELLAARAPASAGAPVRAADLLATSFDARVSLALADGVYEASARPLVAAASTWLEGPLVTEWTLVAPLVARGAAHPHLTARFDVRAHAGLGTVAVSVTVENVWAYQPAPQNFTYDATIATDAGTVLSAPRLVHYRQARWRHSFVWGADAALGVEHDRAYLVATGAVPRFDPSVRASERALAALETGFAGAAAAPLGIGLATAYMPTTGGRGDIGPVPSWTSLYVVSQDARAKRATLGTADRAGSWSIHYRDKTTGRPVSLDDFPLMTILGNPGDTCDPNTGKCQSFPACGGDCRSPYTPDSPHQPSLSYVPYLLTGDRYHLEELQFWANWNMLQANPAYRGRAKGLLNWDQPRGQAWSMRTLGQAAYITPDADPMKKYFVDRVKHNLDWYNEKFSRNPQANALGYIDSGYTIGTDGTMAPWMDDFFTWSIGHLLALGFEEARPLRDWKARYPIGRMMEPAYCWIFATVYHMAVKDPASGRLHASWAEVYGPTLADAKATAAASLPCGGPEMAAVLKLRPGEMVGASSSPEGYPSNFQPALAVAAESGLPGARAAWDRFMSRAVKPDYSDEPQFAIVPP